MSDEQSHPSIYPQISGDLLSRTNLFRWIREFVRTSDIPIGYYIEFGVLNGESLIDAYRQLRGHLSHMYGFDSFCGLPEPTERDQTGDNKSIYRKGNFQSMDKEMVQQTIELSCRIPHNQLTLVEGFFEDSFSKFDTSQLANKGPMIAAYLDCNLYSSTATALRFIEDKISTGTWLLLDDYWCHRGSPKLGQRLAFEQWLAKPSNRFGVSDYGNFRGFGKAFIVYEK